MTLFRGDREYELLYLGHGHTGGNVVVYYQRARAVLGRPAGERHREPDRRIRERVARCARRLKAIDFVDVITRDTASRSRRRTNSSGLPARPLAAGGTLHDPNVLLRTRPSDQHDRAQSRTTRQSTVPASIPAVTQMYEASTADSGQHPKHRALSAAYLHGLRYAHNNWRFPFRDAARRGQWRSTRSPTKKLSPDHSATSRRCWSSCCRALVRASALAAWAARPSRTSFFTGVSLLAWVASVSYTSDRRA